MIPPKTTVIEDRATILAPLFEGLWIPPVILPVLQGEMGFACVDRLEEPTVCCLSLSDFVMFAGDAGSPSASYFAATTARPCYLLPSSSEWTGLVRRKAQSRGKPRTRYSFDADSLDPEVLRAAAGPPTGYEVRRFDGEAVKQAAAQEWSRSLVENFPSVDYFLGEGVGYGVFEAGRLVCGASSFGVYRDTVEIEVDTHPAYRRRGFATVAAARLAEHCLDRGLVPHWDAANESSRALAQKLGFRIDRSYEVLEI